MNTQLTSEHILSIMENSFEDHQRVVKVQGHRIGEKVLFHPDRYTTYSGYVRAFVIKESNTYAWVEVPLANGRARHYGATLQQIR